MVDELDISRRRALKEIGAVAATAIGTPILVGTPTQGAQPGTVASTPARTVSDSAIKFGVTANQGASFDQILSFWEGAEGLGFDSAFVFDHFMAMTPGTPEQERSQEAWTLLAGLAARTRRLRVGVLVNGCTYRHPAIVAKMAATIDQLSGGRLILGLGAGWMEREHTAYGIPFYTKGIRARRLGETVEVVKLLFSQERATYSGKYFELKDAPLEPKPLQKPHPPILIGGSGRKVVQPIAAKHAQIWHFGLPNPQPDEIKRVTTTFDEICRSVGRDPSEVVKATSFGVPTNDQTFDVLRSTLANMIAAGIRYFILLPTPDNNLDPLRQFAQKIVSEIRR